MSATTQGNHRMRVNDTVVVVTGASSGIGRATALAFANHGASLRQDLMLDGSRGIKVARVLPATIDNEPAPARGRSTATPTADGARPVRRARSGGALAGALATAPRRRRRRTHR